MALLERTIINSTGAIALPYGTEYSRPIVKLQQFTSSGSTTWTCPAGVYNIEVLVVGGGGGGGANHAGGGGGGGVIYNPSYGVIPGTVYTVIVGAGGAGSTAYLTGRAGHGTNSQFNDLIAKGGGPGGNRQDGGTASLQYGYDGGSGGGAGGLGSNDAPRIWAGGRGANNYPNANIESYEFQGNPGGYATYHSGGGGGGAGLPGRDGRSSGGSSTLGCGGRGGDGYPCAITGETLYYGGGGGGGMHIGGFFGGRGGWGGGGLGGGHRGGVDTAGTANRGGGGGGGDGGGNNGSDGGSGVVILRYIDPLAIAFTNAGTFDFSETTKVHSGNASDWQTMKTFVAKYSGTFNVKFTAYIQSGTYYFAYRVRSNGTTTIGSGYFSTNLDAAMGGNNAAVHNYRYFSVSCAMNAGDVITVEMISSTGSGTPVSGVSQILYMKDLYVDDNYTFWTCPAGVTSVEALVVAGGGGSGGCGNTGYYSGGGGGGGVIYNAGVAVTAGTRYTITVGMGGRPGHGGSVSASSPSADSGYRGGSGGNSTITGSGFSTITAFGGGGGGGGYGSGGDGLSGVGGGSGGGGALYGGAGGSGTAGQGNAGGSGQNSYAGGGSGGGGGGAGGAGGSSNGSGTAGLGGAGYLSSISGESRYYGGGGAASGGTASGTHASGATPAYLDGEMNTGAGGGGTISINGRWGGSGIVIFRHASIPLYSTGTTTNSPGVFLFNVMTKKVEVYTKHGYGSVLKDGLTKATAAKNAWVLRAHNAQITSGYYWIQPPDQVARLCYCDFDYYGGCWVLVQSVGGSTGYHSDRETEFNLYEDYQGRSHVQYSGRIDRYAGFVNTTGVTSTYYSNSVGRRLSDEWVRSLGESGEGIFRLEVARNGAGASDNYSNTFDSPSTDWRYTGFARMNAGAYNYSATTGSNVYGTAPRGTGNYLGGNSSTIHQYSSLTNGGSSDNDARSFDASMSYPFVWEQYGNTHVRTYDSNYRVFDWHSNPSSIQFTRYGTSRFLWSYPGAGAAGIYGGSDSFTGNANGNPGYMWVR